MCNAANKAMAAVLAAAALTACGDKQAEQRRQQAESMVAGIEACVGNEDFVGAKALIDSLNKTYPQEIEARRAATGMLPGVIEGLTLQQIVIADSVRDAATREYAGLLPQMRFVGGEDREYYVVANAGGGSPRIEARVRDEFPEFYVVARNDGKPVGLNQVGLTTSGGARFMSEAIPDGNDRAMVVEGTELAVFLNEEVNEMGRSAYVSGEVNGAVLAGPKGSVPVKLTKEQAASFATAWHFADAARRLREADINRERLERQLMIARQQKKQ